MEKFEERNAMMTRGEGDHSSRCVIQLLALLPSFLILLRVLCLPPSHLSFIPLPHPLSSCLPFLSFPLFLTLTFYRCSHSFFILQVIQIFHRLIIMTNDVSFLYFSLLFRSFEKLSKSTGAHHFQYFCSYSHSFSLSL